MQIIPLPAFRDNYIWLLRAGTCAVVVDPGEAAPVLRYLADEGLTLAAILITHHHPDHVGGVAELLALAPVPVYGPALETIAGIDHLGHPSFDFLVRAWAWPNSYDLFLMGVCGVIAAVAMSLLTNAYRTADANLVTVFEYTGMFWAPLWGFLFFSEIPRWTTLTGLGLILVAGLISVRLAAAMPLQSYQMQSDK